MFYLNDGDIVPAKRIGILELGMSFEQIVGMIKDYQVDDLGEAWLINGGDVQIWINKGKNAAYQIMVFGSFKGKYANIIGIGSTLGDVKKFLHVGWHEEMDTTVLDNAPGMCFQPDDTEGEEDADGEDDYETYELEEPIGYISVYRDLPYQNDDFNL